MTKKIKELTENEKVIKSLRIELERLREENESLWFMLDEIEASDIMAKTLMDEEREKHMIEILENMNPVGDS
jgi:ribosomal silencing factor RsfS